MNKIKKVLECLIDPPVIATGLPLTVPVTHTTNPCHCDRQGAIQGLRNQEAYVKLNSWMCKPRIAPYGRKKEFQCYQKRTESCCII